MGSWTTAPEASLQGGHRIASLPCVLAEGDERRRAAFLGYPTSSSARGLCPVAGVLLMKDLSVEQAAANWFNSRLLHRCRSSTAAPDQISANRFVAHHRTDESSPSFWQPTIALRVVEGECVPMTSLALAKLPPRPSAPGWHSRHCGVHDAGAVRDVPWRIEQISGWR